MVSTIRKLSLNVDGAPCKLLTRSFCLLVDFVVQTRFESFKRFSLSEDVQLYQIYTLVETSSPHIITIVTTTTSESLFQIKSSLLFKYRCQQETPNAENNAKNVFCGQSV